LKLLVRFDRSSRAEKWLFFRIISQNQPDRESNQAKDDGTQQADSNPCALAKSGIPFIEHRSSLAGYRLARVGNDRQILRSVTVGSDAPFDQQYVFTIRRDTFTSSF
jgi:hypothetical protein